ncbi:MAG: hypothetical protein H6658_07965 [Ardenticatenaceae bacterium]|nr:hypothetical protein [Ardenticatenaceae bacterium]
MGQKIEIDLPNSIYSQLKAIADSSSWSFDEVILQTIRNGLPPLLGKVPHAFHQELLALNGLTDRDLWGVVEGKITSSTDMTDEEYRRADFDLLRRTYALSVLKWRGHPIPEPYDALIL